MTAFLIANMAPLMFAALVVFLLLGYPVAFSLAANGLLFGVIAIELGLLHPSLLQALPERVFGIMRNDIFHTNDEEKDARARLVAKGATTDQLKDFDEKAAKVSTPEQIKTLEANY